MPCNVDITTQEILKFAEEADPSGVRTMGVLTKPDLATEKATQDAVMDLLLERRNVLKLGYHVSSIPDHCSIASLKTRLRELLMLITRREFGPVKTEIEGRLRKCRAELEIMGTARDDPNAQRRYLGNLAAQFQKTTLSARNGYYAEDKVFNQPEPNLKLITKIVKLNEAFADILWRRGHKHRFEDALNNEDEPSFGSDTEDPLFEIPLEAYPELHDIVEAEEYTCPEPLTDPVMSLIEKEFVSSRGPELGTKRRNERMCKSLKALAVSHTNGENYVPIKAVHQHSAVNKHNGQQVCEDILDTLMSYYKVARKRFVDVVCQHVIYHFLMDIEDGPLRIFSPDLVMSLDTEELEMVASEDADSKRRREILKREIDSLETALKILRS
ncbi:hypothetical protein BDV11DRAFT_201469 [Aspergillus similis]